jgi:hypothetical protein
MAAFLMSKSYRTAQQKRAAVAARMVGVQLLPKPNYAKVLRLLAASIAGNRTAQST